MTSANLGLSLGPGSTVSQGESHALQVLLDRVPGEPLLVTADCKPAIRQAESSVFPSWHSSAEERRRLSVTWVRSHGSDQDFCAAFGIPEGHQDFVSRLDGVKKFATSLAGWRGFF